MAQARGRDLVVVTGGLGCAPVVSAIAAVERDRSDYGRLAILEGVRHHKALIYPDRFRAWRAMERTEVVLCCDEQAAPWPWHTDQVTAHLDKMSLNLADAVALLCGPEGMMVAAARVLEQQGMAESAIWLSLERNMQCGDGYCGHCQIGRYFVCRDGPVFSWAEIRDLLSVKGL